MVLRWDSANGEIIDFSDKSKYLLEDWQGYGYHPNDIKTVKSPYQIGNTLIGQIINPRDIEIDFTIITDNKDHLYSLKRAVIKAFNPLNGSGKLTYINTDNKYKITAVSKNSPSFQKDNKTNQKIKLKLHAPDPRWYNPDEINIPIKQSNEIINKGDTFTAIKLTLNGPMSNPAILNMTTGEKIQLNHTISSDEKIVVNTKFGDKSIHLYDSYNRKRNSFSILSFDSRLFGLQSGSNLIEFRASNMNEQSKINISYKERYLGI